MTNNTSVPVSGRSEFVRYLLVGIGNTTLAFAVVLVGRLYLSETTANLLAYLIVVPVSFFTHRTISFRDRKSMWISFFRYLPVILFCYLGNLVILHALLHFGIWPPLAQVVSIASYVLATYLLGKHFVFAKV